eukprot:s3370_g11.t2
MSVPLGWLCANRFCRVLCPDGLQGACGLSSHGFLKLLDIGRSAIRSNVDAGGLPLPVKLDLSRFIYDSGLESFHAMRQVFTTGVSIATFRPIGPVENEMYCCIALPSSIADSLANGFPTAIPFPLGQLNICLNIESALRKMSHWHRQGCFGNLHCREDTSILVFRPVRNHVATELRRSNGRGGYANFHNCAFIGSSWCLTIDSSDDLTWTLPRPCQESTIVLRLEGLSVKAMTNIVHNASFAHWLPGESIHRHCAFPLSMNQVEPGTLSAEADDDATDDDASPSFLEWFLESFVKIIGYASAVYEAYPAYPSTCVAILQCIAIRACLTVASFCCSRASTAENRQWSVQVRIGNGVSIDVRTTDRPKTASRPKFDEDDERAQNPGAHDAPSSGVPGSSNDGPGGVARAPSERSEGSSEVLGASCAGNGDEDGDENGDAATRREVRIEVRIEMRRRGDGDDVVTTRRETRRAKRRRDGAARDDDGDAEPSYPKSGLSSSLWRAELCPQMLDDNKKIGIGRAPRLTRAVAVSSRHCQRNMSMTDGVAEGEWQEASPPRTPPPRRRAERLACGLPAYINAQKGGITQSEEAPHIPEITASFRPRPGAAGRRPYAAPGVPRQRCRTRWLGHRRPRVKSNFNTYHVRAESLGIALAMKTEGSFTAFVTSIDVVMTPLLHGCCLLAAPGVDDESR